jgi:hypothetical protein
MNDSIMQVIYYLLEGGASEEKRIKELEKQERKDKKDRSTLLVTPPSEYARLVPSARADMSSAHTA